MFQQQVPLPLPCFNFIQITPPSLRTKTRLNLNQVKCQPPFKPAKLFEYDGRCVQSLNKIHHDDLIRDY